MGSDIVFPAAAYLAMAVEAIYQSSKSLAFSNWKDQADGTRFRLRDITFAKALVLQDGGIEHRIMLTLTPRPGAKAAWHEFKISSLTDDVWTEHCHGLVSLEEDTKDGKCLFRSRPRIAADTAPVAPESALKPLKFPTSAHLWYKAMEGAGYSFGPIFQKQLEVESVAGEPYSRAILSLSDPPSVFSQSSYPMHPVCIDGCLQASAASLWNGHRSSVNTVLIPAMMDEIIINATPAKPKTGIAVSTAEYSGIGNLEEKKSYKSNVTVYDPSTGSLLFQVSGLRYHSIDTREGGHATHTYNRLVWKPDVTYLSQGGLRSLLLEKPTDSSPVEIGSGTRIDQLIDMVAHKKPTLRVIEVNMLPTESRSMWLNGSHFNASSRAVCGFYHVASATPAGLLEAQEKHGSGNTTFSLLDLTESPEVFTASNKDFDLAIVKLVGVPILGLPWDVA